MASITGIVDCINTGDDFGFVRIIESGTNVPETLIIWFAPSEPSAFTRVLHSMWLSMLRDSLDNGRVVSVVTSNGATITSMTLNQ